MALEPRPVIENLDTPAAARDAMQRPLAAEHAHTAVFCANNRLPIGALEAVLPRGADVAITGFDDVKLSRLLPRRIRVVDDDMADLGTRAAESLLRRVADPATGSLTHLIPTRLVDRGIS